METSKISATTIGLSGDGATPFARAWQILTLGDRLGRRAAVVVWLAAAIGLDTLFSVKRFFP